MFYPAFLDLRNRRVLVVGGGAVAERKVNTLLMAGAAVTLVSPEVTPQICSLGNGGNIELRQRSFMESDLDDVGLVISTTDDSKVQKQVALAARSKNIFINTVDQPDLCNFIVPAIVRRGDVVLAISTSGQSPALAAALRVKLDGVLTEEVARTARVLGSVRSEVHERFAEPEQRKRIFETIIESGIVEWIGACDDEAALKRVREMIEKLA